MKKTKPLSEAKSLSGKILDFIKPFVERAEIAGSIRRARPHCNDIDIVCIPKRVENRDLLGDVVASRNLLWEMLKEKTSAPLPSIFWESGGEVEGKQCVLWLHRAQMQLDLWFATPETFATRLLCRTGSMQHNIWLASRAKRLGWKWNPYEGILKGGQWRKVGDAEVYDGGHLNSAETEHELYALLELPFIEPKNREQDWLVKNFGQ